jgi:hypothetical protein
VEKGAQPRVQLRTQNFPDGKEFAGTIATEDRKYQNYNDITQEQIQSGETPNLKSNQIWVEGWGRPCSNDEWGWRWSCRLRFYFITTHLGVDFVGDEDPGACSSDDDNENHDKAATSTTGVRERAKEAKAKTKTYLVSMS